MEKIVREFLRKRPEELPFKQSDTSMGSTTAVF